MLVEQIITTSSRSTYNHRLRGPYGENVARRGRLLNNRVPCRILDSYAGPFVPLVEQEQ